MKDLDWHYLFVATYVYLFKIISCLVHDGLTLGVVVFSRIAYFLTISFFVLGALGFPLLILKMLFHA